MTDDANNAAERMATSPPADSDSPAVEPADSSVAETTVFTPVDEANPETATKAVSSPEDAAEFATKPSPPLTAADAPSASAETEPVNTEHSPQEDASVAAAAESPAESEAPLESEAPVEDEVATTAAMTAAEPETGPEVGEDAVDAEKATVTSDGAIEEDLEPDDGEDVEMDWYILKVQSNRERSIAEALQRKISVEGLDRYFGQVIVPMEKVTEYKGGKKRVVERKLYPGYIVVHMHINDDTWFAVRETSGIGDFTGAAGKPTPMLPGEVSRIVKKDEEETTDEPKLDIKFREGDKVKITEGNFESFEGEVSGVDVASGRVTVMINIFGRSTPVELEYWHLETT